MWFFSSAATDIKNHVSARDRALCYPLPLNDESSSEPISSSQTLATNVHQLTSTEIDLQPGDEEILRCDISGLTQGIKNGQFTSTRVLCAFIRGARRAQRETNCLTEGE